MTLENMMKATEKDMTPLELEIEVNIRNNMNAILNMSILDFATLILYKEEC